MRTYLSKYFIILSLITSFSSFASTEEASIRGKNSVKTDTSDEVDMSVPGTDSPDVISQDTSKDLTKSELSEENSIQTANSSAEERDQDKKTSVASKSPIRVRDKIDQSTVKTVVMGEMVRDELMKVMLGLVEMSAEEIKELQAKLEILLATGNGASVADAINAGLPPSFVDSEGNLIPDAKIDENGVVVDGKGNRIANATLEGGQVFDPKSGKPVPGAKIVNGKIVDENDTPIDGAKIQSTAPAGTSNANSNLLQALGLTWVTLNGKLYLVPARSSSANNDAEGNPEFQNADDQVRVAAMRS